MGIIQEGWEDSGLLVGDDGVWSVWCVVPTQTQMNGVILLTGKTSWP